MRIPIYQVDAFTDRVFGGNPAAVCPLERWLTDEVLQAIGLENNLSETAFFVPTRGGEFELRWFTPATEVDLCGHATLATAHVIFERLESGLSEVRFRTKSGTVGVKRKGDLLELDFPAYPPSPAPANPALFEALGGEPLEQLHHEQYVTVRYATEAEIRELSPRMDALIEFGTPVLVTAPGDEVDFVSRFFAPSFGIPEDPVTGSAHCISAPYWAKVLGRNPLRARQISPRGGELVCEVRGASRYAGVT